MPFSARKDALTISTVGKEEIMIVASLLSSLSELTAKAPFSLVHWLDFGSGS